MNQLTINQMEKNRKWFSLTSTTRLLFYELAFLYAGKEWGKEFYCSNGYLCECLGVSEKTLLRCRESLIEVGFISFRSSNELKKSGIYSFPCDPDDSPDDKGILDKYVDIFGDRIPANILLYILYIFFSIKKRKKEKNKKKERIVLAEFEKFRQRYPGSKRGLETEYKNFQRRHTDYEEVLPLLYPAVEKLIQWTIKRGQRGQFVPDYPSLQTWINQRRWETELPDTNYYE